MLKHQIQMILLIQLERKGELNLNTRSKALICFAPVSIWCFYWGLNKGTYTLLTKPRQTARDKSTRLSSLQCKDLMVKPAIKRQHRNLYVALTWNVIAAANPQPSYA